MLRGEVELGKIVCGRIRLRGMVEVIRGRKVYDRRGEVRQCWRICVLVVVGLPECVYGWVYSLNRLDVLEQQSAGS